MPSPELSENGSFYQLACHTTDTFTSCIRIYEALLPYFEAETPGEGVNGRLFNIDGMLTTLYNELTTLKNEITTAIDDDDDDDNDDTAITDDDDNDTAITDDDDNDDDNDDDGNNDEGGEEEVEEEDDDDDDTVSKPSDESKKLTKLISEHNQHENIIYEEACSVDQKVFHEDKILNNLPKRSWEAVRKVPGEEYQRGKINQEDNKMEQTVSHDEKLCIKLNAVLKKQANYLSYFCETCNETVTVYNEDLEFSVALHNQGGCCRGKRSELVSVPKEMQEKNCNTLSVQEQVQNLTKYQEDTNRLNLTPDKLHTVNKAGGTHFSCIQSTEKGFLCTVCNKKLAGSKNFVEHIRGSYHQTLLKESAKEIQKNTVLKTNVSYGQLGKSSQKKSPTSVVQEDSVPSVNTQLTKLIKRVSGSLYSQRQYLSVGKDVIMCNLCGCQIPPTYFNVRSHLLGSRHSKNQTELQLLS